MFTLLLLLAVFGLSVLGCRNVQETYTRDERGGDVDHVALLGDDITKIDKITKVVMRTGNFGPLCPPFGCNVVIRQMEVTYRMVDGSTQIIRFGRNLDTNGVRVFEIPEGEALTRIFVKTGDYLDSIELCHSGGVCSGRFGGSGGVSSRVFQRQRTAIKALFHKSGEVVDRLGVHYETNKIIRLEAEDPTYVPSVDVSMTQVFDPSHILINDNTDGAVEQTQEFSKAVAVTSSETTTVSSTIGGSTSVSLKASVGIDLKVISASIEQTFTVGASWETTNSESSTSSNTIEETNTVSVVAPPGYKIQAEMFYTKADYVYNWTAPLTCIYSFDPSNVVQGGTISGITQGFYGIPVIETKFTTLEAPETLESPPDGVDSPDNNGRSSLDDFSAVKRFHSGFETGTMILLISLFVTL